MSSWALLHSAVYPRVCGGTIQDGTKHAGEIGLSPRVRGNPHRSRWLPERPGSIPACAGEPLAR